MEIPSVYKLCQNIEYMIDSGACANALSWESARQYGEQNIDYADQKTFSAFNGTLSKAIGSISLDLHVGNSCYIVKFYVLETLDFPGIIGAEFLRTHLGAVGENFKTIFLKKNYPQAISSGQDSCTNCVDNLHTSVGETNREDISFELKNMNVRQESQELLVSIEDKNVDFDLLQLRNSKMITGSERLREIMRQLI